MTTIVNIPTDYLTLQAAIDDLVAQGVQSPVTLNIESGHQPSTGIVLRDGIYSNFDISSEDAVVTLHSTFSAEWGFIDCKRAQSPVLNCLVNADGRAKFGVLCWVGGQISANIGCGVKNARERNICLTSSARGDLNGTIWTGAGSIAQSGLVRAAWVSRGSTMIAEEADFSDSEGIAIYVSRASTAHAMNVRAENAAEGAVWVHRSSRFTAHSESGRGTALSTRAGSTADVVKVDRSSIASINADGGGGPVTITQNGSGSAVTVESSIVDIASATISGGAFADKGINAGAGSVNASAVSIDGFMTNLYTNGGRVNANFATLTGARGNGVLAARGEVDIASGSVTGSIGKDLAISNGGFLRADGCTTTNSVGTPAIGDTNRPSFNALSGAGVIFA
jgi:hypothetical protein